MNCDGCTFCCYVLPVSWLNKKAGVLCPNCTENKGCNIWKDRPQGCKDFQCAYTQMKKAHINMRPDNCFVMWERFNNIMHGTMHPEHNDAYTHKIIREQMSHFLNEGLSVVFASQTLIRPIVISRDRKAGSVIAELQGVWHGSRIICN